MMDSGTDNTISGLITGSAVQAGTIHQVILPPSAASGQSQVPSIPTTWSGVTNLPRDIADFTGRDRELRVLVDAIHRPMGDAAQTILIHAIDGMPGVGKTALGTHAAHVLASRYPDGQVFLDLYGHTPGQKALPPFDALHSLLLALGVHPDVISNHKTVEDRARLWRTLAAGRRLLLVLDDAADHRQVSPLLPGSPGSLVVITSRNRMPELDGVQPLTVDVLSPDDAVWMLLRLARRAPDEVDVHDAHRMVELCGWLPLAIAITASQLRVHPGWPVRHLLDQLIHAHDRLDELEAGDRSVRAAFDTSLRDLTADQRELFALLGVHHGPEIDAHAAAALADLPTNRVGRIFGVLHTRHLVQETAPGRYRLHDLLRAYARTHAARLDSDHHGRATARVLDYYLHTAHNATKHFPLYHTPSTPITPTPPAQPRSIADLDQAMTWLTTELPVLATAIDHTHGEFPLHTITLSTTLHSYLRTSGHWEQAYVIHRLALTAAQAMDDLHAQATALNEIGIVRRRFDDLDSAMDAHVQALDLYTRSGSLVGQGNALNYLGFVHERRGDHDAAIDAFGRALRLHALSGSSLGQSVALNEIGYVNRLRGNLGAAMDAHTRALDLYTRTGSLVGQGNALNYLGIVHERRGDHDAAIDAFGRALDLYVRCGYLVGQGNALNHLGNTHERRDDLDAAMEAHTRAFELHLRSGSLLGQGNALNGIGHAHRALGNLDAAVDVFTRAVELHTRSGSLQGRANSHLGLGMTHHLRRDHPAAAADLAWALDLYRRAEDADGQARTHNALGDLTFDHPSDVDSHTHYAAAEHIARTCDIRLHEANALVGEARCFHRDGATGQAITLLRRALVLHREIHAVAEASKAARLLHSLGSATDLREL
jgi:tetratricopeptide (TPR) repeat protein